MKKSELSQFQIWGILGGAAIMLSLAMGMRQSFGLLQPHMIRDIGITAADFSMAVALQNIVWGATQPVVGIWADKYGTRPVALLGVLTYILGLLFLRFADSAWMVTLGIGFCVGIALSCTASNIAMNITARTVSPLKRGAAMGAVSAIGSLGLTIASPMTQSLITNVNWQMAAVGFLGLACVMFPAAFWGSKADQIEPEAVIGKPQSATDAITEALGHKGYRVLAIAFFVCGLQLVFITTHLPAYLDICGMDPTVGSNTLALVGLFNVIGSYLFGWLGDRYSKRMLLGSIYMLRSLALFMFFSYPPSPTTTLIFGAVLGTLWLGVVPLVSGLIVHLFGLRFMATLSGIAFMSHQVGSFLGAWGGGYIFNLFGNYDLAWKLAVAIGLAAGLFQMTMNTQPSERIRNQLAT